MTERWKRGQRRREKNGETERKGQMEKESETHFKRVRNVVTQT